jgi:hypothetical protein
MGIWATPAALSALARRVCRRLAFILSMSGAPTVFMNRIFAPMWQTHGRSKNSLASSLRAVLVGDLSEGTADAGE